MMNVNAIQSGIESLIWGYSPFLGLKGETYSIFFGKKEPVTIRGARNRLLNIDFSDIMDSIDSTKSAITIQKTHLKMDIFINTDKLIEKFKQRTLPYDKPLLKQQLSHLFFNWERPLSTVGWNKVNENVKTLNQLTDNQIQEMVQRIYLEAIDYQLLHARDMTAAYLKQLEGEDSVLYGNVNYAFKEAFAGLNNLRDHTFLTLKEMQGQIGLTNRFIAFNETFSKAYLGYLDFILTFNDLSAKKVEQLNRIRTARETYQELLAELGLLEPVKLSIPQIQALMQMTEAL